MAAVSESAAYDLEDLRRIQIRHLEPLLERECAEWQRKLDWDFRPSASLILRFAGVQALTGYALMGGGALAGYTYFVQEESKGLIGDLYVAEDHRTTENEARLLAASLDEMFRSRGLRRVESQLMMLRSPDQYPLPHPEFLRIHPRHFMAVGAVRIGRLRPGPAARRTLIENWSERRHDEAAQVISAAYDGHVDSDVNDQYRSVSGARRFIHNIVQYPGCGTFFQPASFVALDAWTGRACGVSLTSMLAPGVGHVTQICVTPRLKGKGLGYELLRRSLLALTEAGCRKATLTVTAANSDAAALYQRVGFKTAHSFAALVWDRSTASG